MKKALKIIGIILAVIAALAVIIVLAFNVYQHVNYKEYFSTAEKAFAIPGLDDDFVPQGLTYDDKSNMYVICGYQNKGEEYASIGGSRVYYYDPETGKYDYLNIMEHGENGWVYSSTHAGGLTMYGDYIFICTDGLISVYNRYVWTADQLENGACIGDMVPIATFDPATGPAFCHIEGDYLYVGEFYIAEDYETPKSHHIYTDTGDFNQAIMTVFNIEDVIAAVRDNATETIVPVAAYSITDNAQGMCFDSKGNICISTSWGLTTSHVKIYEDPMQINEEPDDTFTTDAGDEIPLYYLDSAHLLKDCTLQPMSEELCLDGDRILVMCESASNKYIFGKLTGSKYCYSFVPEY